MNILKRLFCRHDYKFVRNIDWKRSLWICPKCGSFQYRNEIKCDGCNNVKGCITCEDGSEWAHYEEPVSEDLEEAAWNHPSAIHTVSPQWSSEVINAFKAGAAWQKQHLIEKACEWLEEHLLDFWSQVTTNTDYFIEDFKKAMNN